MSPRLQVVKPKAPDGPTIHTCSCGKTFSQDAWNDLPIIGFFDSLILPEESGELVQDRFHFGHARETLPRLEILEQRNCICGSTRAISIDLPRAFALMNEQCKAVRRATSALVDATRLRGDVPEREDRSGPAELVRIEREACAQVVDQAAADLRLVALAKPGQAMKRELLNRAELADEIAASIRRRL